MSAIRTWAFSWKTCPATKVAGCCGRRRAGRLCRWAAPASRTAQVPTRWRTSRRRASDSRRAGSVSDRSLKALQNSGHSRSRLAWRPLLLHPRQRQLHHLRLLAALDAVGHDRLVVGRVNAEHVPRLDFFAECRVEVLVLAREHFAGRIELAPADHDAGGHAVDPGADILFVVIVVGRHAVTFECGHSGHLAFDDLVHE